MRTVLVVQALVLITGSAIACHYGLITADAAGRHPLTFTQVWGGK